MSAIDTTQSTEYHPRTLQPSTISNFPIDILAYIFQLVNIAEAQPHSGASNTHSYIRINRQFPPYILACVSRYWRVVVTSTPKLWSTFACPAVGWDNECRCILEMCLNYSASLPLYLIIYVQPGRSNALKQLIRQSHRWKHVEIVEIDARMSSAPVFGLLPLVGLPENSFPELEQLHIECAGNFIHQYALELMTVFRTAPLTKLQFDFRSLPSSLGWTELAFTWSKLTHIKAECTMDGLRTPTALLEICPALVDCTIRAFSLVLSFDYPDSLLSKPPIHMSALQSLVIFDQGSFETLLYRLRTPVLQRLKAYRTREEFITTPELRTSIEAFFKSAPELREVELSSWRCDKDVLVRALKHAKKVERLTLVDSGSGSATPIVEVLNALSRDNKLYGGGHHLHFPHLVYLAVRMDRHLLEEHHLEALNDMRSGTAGFDAFEHFQFEYLAGSPLTAEVKAGIQRLRDSGVNVVVKYTKLCYKIGLPAGHLVPNEEYV